MTGERSRPLIQRFLPEASPRAFVWKYAESIGGRRPRHFHSEPELNLVVRGSATFGIGARVVSVHAGELLAFPAGQDHALLAASSDLFLYAIGLDPAYSSKVLGPRHPASGPLHVRLAAAELSPVVAAATDAVDRPGADQLCAELWSRVHWLGERAASRAPATHVLTRRALQAMAAEAELGLDGLARELRAHPSDVSRYFHRDVGVTLVRYRTRLRLLNVIELVDSGRYDLMAAASAAGFGSYSQCHRSFQSELGCAPRDFFRSELRSRMQLTYAPSGN
ncbi:MAG TPA: AraC family transcriptional regulator [Polyangiaceae bacterium]|nr:AraC family transcriptional regulator [Polyangiaceae bacterium]